MELTPEACWHIHLVLVLHILQLWLPCGLREAVHSCQDTLCTSHAPITWLSTDSDKLQKREVVSWDWSSSSQTIPWLSPSSAFCSPEESGKYDCTRTTFAMTVPMCSQAQPTRTLGHKEPDGGSSEGDCFSCLPPNKSYLLWFEIAHVRLGLV